MGSWAWIFHLKNLILNHHSTLKDLVVREEIWYILLIASELRYTGMLLNIQQEIFYTLAFKVTYIQRTTAIRTFLQRIP